MCKNAAGTGRQIPMNMQAIMRFSGLTLLLLVWFSTGCKTSEQREKELKHNVIKEYVNVPKDKATKAKAKVEGEQDKIKEQSKELFDEE